MFNSERTAGLRDFSPDAHPKRDFWQGSRVSGVTGTKAVAAEHVVEQKVRLQSHCFPKLQRLLSICSRLPFCLNCCFATLRLLFFSYPVIFGRV